MRENQKSGRLSTVQPGHIWLIEHTSATELFACDRGALTGADVVIFDPALAPVVASVLPVGAYAEPMPRDVAAAGSAIARRALGLASDGWSVVQLVATPAERRAALQGASEALISLGYAGELPVLSIAKTRPNRYEERDASLRTLPGLADELDADDLLTLIIGPLAARYPARCYAFAANGLAG